MRLIWSLRGQSIGGSISRETQKRVNYWMTHRRVDCQATWRKVNFRVTYRRVDCRATHRRINYWTILFIKSTKYIKGIPLWIKVSNSECIQIKKGIEDGSLMLKMTTFIHITIQISVEILQVMKVLCKGQCRLIIWIPRPKSSHKEMIKNASISPIHYFTSVRVGSATPTPTMLLYVYFKIITFIGFPNFWSTLKSKRTYYTHPNFLNYF